MATMRTAGKSQVATYAVAAISTGRELPVSNERAPLGTVLIVQAEDGVADTLVPRLEQIPFSLVHNRTS